MLLHILMLFLKGNINKKTVSRILQSELVLQRKAVQIDSALQYKLQFIQDEFNVKLVRISVIYL